MIVNEIAKRSWACASVAVNKHHPPVTRRYDDRAAAVPDVQKDNFHAQVSLGHG